MNAPIEKSRFAYDDYTVFGHISAPQDGEHFVEDARTILREKKSLEPPKRRKVKHRSGRRTLLTVLVTIFAFSATLFAADLLSGRSGIAEYAALFTGGKEKDGTEYYAVYASKGTDMAIAYKNAAAVRSEGGAGYVLKDDDLFYVILNVYNSEEDARSVAAKEPNYAVYELRIPPFNTSKAKSLEPAEEYTYLFEESYHVLYQAANSLATGQYGKEDMRRDLEKQKASILAIESAYSEKIRGQEDTPRIEYKVLLSELRSAFENLTNEDSHLVADARYYSVMILHSYALFSEKYFV